MNFDASTSAETLFSQASLHLTEGQYADAEACLQRAILVAPDFAEAYANLAFLNDIRGADVDAEACYQRVFTIIRPQLDAGTLDHGFTQHYLNFGAFLAKQKRFSEAEAAYQQAIALNPQAYKVWSNLGVLYASMQREAEAEQCYRTALALNGEYATARFNLSYLLLRRARFAEGWQCLEARQWYAKLEAHLLCPRWRGESLKGRSLLIGFEAGHGDMIQFCRYASVLKARGARQITLLCHPALKALFATLMAVDEVIAFNEPVAKTGWDFWTPPLSIPYYCETRLESIPAPIPYLAADPILSARWATVLATQQWPANSLRVGLVWKGSPQFENDADRSMPGLDALLPMADVPNVQLISLQKGAGEDEACHPPAGMRILHLGSDIESFADTAAIIVNLDLLICVDTAAAHLAGAMGKPCWLMLPDYKTDWRWLTQRDDSPWYPHGMHLFRQPHMGDWQTVVTEMRQALEILSASRSQTI